MMGMLAFLNPWMLAALVALPLIWLILRLTPPRPRRVAFPPTRILIGLEEREKTPSKTPWWLTALRLALLGAVIVALAEPVLRPDARLTAGNGPLLLVFDNGWDAAPDFAERVDAAETVIEEAGREGRPVTLVATSEAAAPILTPATAGEAAKRLAALAPRPYLPDHAALAGRLAAALEAASAEVVWIAAPLAGSGTGALAEALDRIGRRGLLVTSAGGIVALRPPENAAEGIRIAAVATRPAGPLEIAGFDEKGRRILETSTDFAADGTAEAAIELPVELRNALSRFEVVGARSAGAVQLLDASWRRKTVGLIAGEAGDAAQPLLAPLTYVDRALARGADVLAPQASTVAASIDALIQRQVSVIVLTDTGNLPPQTVDRLSAWLEAGGTLVRFASPRLSSAQPELLPVRLREGERALGGSLSWEEPQPIGSFDDDGPFARIAVPADVRINRQILADPQDLANVRIWADLNDGTPLVTARYAGAGRIVLFHVTADPRWSTLPISGAFVEMLNALVDTANSIDPAAIGSNPTAGESADAARSAPWAPARILDGYGELVAPPSEATLLADIEAAVPSAVTPPGYYERAGTVRALNAVSADLPIVPFSAVELRWSGEQRALEPRRATPLWPWVLALAAFLAVLDGIAVLALSGRMLALRGAAAASLALAVVAAEPGSLRAQESADDAAAMERALDATLMTRLAYVVTGNGAIDQVSHAGLVGLTAYLASRTALEPGEPVGVDVAADELAFFPFLYWPIDADAPVPPADVMAKVDAFMKNGGTILFDTRDSGGAILPGSFGASAETERLRALLAFIDVPPLEPVPPDHVLTKAFYLLSEFPGRWRNSDLWVESLSDVAADPERPARGGDGVSPIMITGNDFAGAWAVSADGRYLYPTVPADPRQRELALRAGVNIVMYTMTGNYKADQVHVPALLERLGQ